MDQFSHAHAHDLLAEREEAARTVASQLTNAAHELLRLHRAYVAERTAVDQLVAAVPGATPRGDGPIPAHPWEAQIKELARIVGEVPECPPPLPRWLALEHRKQEDQIAQGLQRQRLKKKPAVAIGGQDD